MKVIKKSREWFHEMYGTPEAELGGARAPGKPLMMHRRALLAARAVFIARGEMLPCAHELRDRGLEVDR